MNYSKVLLRLMNPLGRYPENSFYSKDASFIVDRRGGFICSIVRTSDIDKQYFDSEISWASISEIRLWASIVLSMDNDKGKLILFPNNTHIRADDFDFAKIPFTDEKIIEMVRQYLFLKVEGLNNSCELHNSISGVEFDSYLQSKVFDKIDMGNHILIRGLSYLLKSQLLMSSNFYFFTSNLQTWYPPWGKLKLTLFNLESSKIVTVHRQAFSAIWDRTPACFMRW